MSESIFREKSLDRISSPEKFDEYVKVSNPGVWMLMAGFLILIAGTIIWSIFGTLDTRIDVAVKSDGTDARCYIDEKNIQMIGDGMKVTVGDNTYDIAEISPNPKHIDAETDPEVAHALDSEKDIWAYEAILEGDPGKGVFQGTILVDSVSPITFVTN